MGDQASFGNFSAFQLHLPGLNLVLNSCHFMRRKHSVRLGGSWRKDKISDKSNFSPFLAASERERGARRLKEDVLQETGFMVLYCLLSTALIKCLCQTRCLVLIENRLNRSRVYN